MRTPPKDIFSISTRHNEKLAVSFSLILIANLLLSTPVLALEETIVTAQKREQSPLEMPLSISVVDGQSINNGSINTLSDINALVPGFQTASPLGSVLPIFSIRGISMADYNTNQSSPIGVYVDEVHLSANFMQGLPLFDIERVEVLRGPQGTFYGKNTTGGAINVISKSPDFKSDGYASLSFGNFNSTSLRTAYETPIIENTVAARLAISVDKTDGYSNNKFQGEDDLSATDRQSARLSIKYQANENIDALLKFHYGRSDPETNAVIPKTTGPGGVMWKMQAGMGDTIFTPFYEALRARGVKFKYFHEIDKLHLDKENPRLVDEISIIKQVDLANGITEYNPLVDIKGLGCWPSNPLYEQIDPEQANLLQENNVDLESFWNNWPAIYEENYQKPLPKIILKRGQDFDIVINGISIGSLPYIAKELLDVSEELLLTHEKVETVVTQAYQLWTDPTLPELGWEDYPDGEEPVLGAWIEPVDTWAAMNQLLDKEDWSADGLDPKNAAYFCGVQPITEIPPRTDLNFPIESKQKVKNAAINQMNNVFYSIWPDAATKGTFNWNILTDKDNKIGEARFDAQYWRSNVSPSERYVQSIVGTTKYRINTKIDDFDNIYFTGDWIKTGINAGCVEAATMGGMLTAQAICGYPTFIYGLKDFGKTPTVDDDESKNQK